MARSIPCFLHIGTYKTGSTSLQQLFAKNRRELLQQGCFFPSELHGWSMKYLAAFAFSHAGKKHSSVNLLKTHGGLPEVTKKIHQELLRARQCGADRIFLSCEPLGSLCSVSAWQSFRELLNQADVELSLVLVCLRGQHARFLGALSQHCRSGRHVGDVESLLPQIPLKSKLNYERMLSSIATVFGKNRICAINYDRKRDELIPIICNHADIEYGRLLSETLENSSYSAAGRLVYATINKALDDLHQSSASDPNPTSRPLVTALESWRSPSKVRSRRQVLDRFLVPQSGNSKFFRNELLAAKSLEKVFLKSNERLRQKYFPRDEPPLFTPLDIKTMEADNSQVLSELKLIVAQLLQETDLSMLGSNPSGVLNALVSRWSKLA